MSETNGGEGPAPNTTAVVCGVAGVTAWLLGFLFFLQDAGIDGRYALWTLPVGFVLLIVAGVMGSRHWLWFLAAPFLLLAFFLMTFHLSI